MQKLDSYSPREDVTEGEVLTLTGTKLLLSGLEPIVLVGNLPCNVTSATSINLTCDAPRLMGGNYLVLVGDPLYGNSNTYFNITYLFNFSSVSPNESGLGGAEIEVNGIGFDPSGGSLVTICGDPCLHYRPSSSPLTSILCTAPPRSENTVCDVEVINPNNLTVVLQSGFSYRNSLTPSISSVSPARGGTAGGTTLTITGSGFA